MCIHIFVTILQIDIVEAGLTAERPFSGTEECLNYIETHELRFLPINNTRIPRFMKILIVYISRMK